LSVDASAQTAAPMPTPTPPAIAPAAPAQTQWVEPHPEIPYLPKPGVQPSNWIVEQPPINPNATPEAKALLHMLYQISGNHTLTGQHNYINEQEFSTNVSAIFTGKTPALYGTDLGFADDGDKDSAYARHAMVQELIKQFHNGHVIAICWHEVPPTMDEPVTFRGQIQSHITDQQFADLLTPGTNINKHWCAQVDTIAEYLKELQDAHVPVLFRPMHEINGDWFWWDGHRGDDTHGTKQLYRMLVDRLINFHHLNNLLFVWNCDQPSRADRQFVDYFPGLNYVDIFGLDFYGAFQQSFYDDMNALSGGKVMAISETSNPPTIDVYKTQPKWAYYMRWAIDKRFAGYMLGSATPPARPATNPASPGSTSTAAPAVPAFVRRGLTKDQFRAIVNDPRMMSLQDRPYLKVFNDILAAAGAPELHHVEKVPDKP
jgi:mannan endo-1,4-beta-mannosidase